MAENKIIDRYLNELRANGLKEATINKEKPTVTQFYDFVSNDINNITKDTVTDFIISWNTEDRLSTGGRRITNIKESTKATRKMILKKFLTWLGKEDIAITIKAKVPPNHLTSADILNIEDVNKLIEATDSFYYKALIAILFESGARIGEIQALQKKNLEETDNGLIVSIPTFKTNTPNRKMLLIFSAQYIRNYFTYSDKKDNDFVFSHKNGSVHRMLQKIKMDAGIDKDVSPHKFRHSQATDMVKRGYNESIIRRKLGWTATSPMIARYQHLNDTDVIDAQLSMNGEAIEKEKMQNINIADPIKIADTNAIIQKQAAKMEEMEKQISEMERIFNDPSVIGAMIEKRVNEILKTK